MCNCIHSHYFCRLARFTLNGCVNMHSNKYWCSENGLLVCEVPLHDFKCWSLVCGDCSQYQGAMLLKETSYFYSVWWVLTSFGTEIREEEKCTFTSCWKVLWPTHRTSWWLTHCGLLKLPMYIHAIIMCERQWNIEFIFSYKVLYKKEGVICFFALNTICRNAATTSSERGHNV